MKYTYLLLAASIGLLAGCSQVEQDSTNADHFSDGDLVEKVIFEVLPIKDGDDPETKASAVPNGGTVGFVWEATDTVGIYPDKGSQVFFNIEDGVGTSSVSFTGGGWALKQNSTYTSYYPFVGDIYLKRDKIPVSFAGQKQIGTTSPFVGARYFLATEPTSSENGVLRFSYKTLNTIINVNATLPAGTYTKASLTIAEPLFVEEGIYSLDNREIVGTKFTNTLEIDLENVTLTQEGVLPIYIMSAPVDLKGKEVTVRIISSDGKKYECVKTPSRAYEAGTRYGLTCDNMEQSNAGNIVFADANIKAALVAAFDTEGDGELSYMEAAAVTSIEGVFGTKKTYTSFDEFQYFTGVNTIPSSLFEGWQISSIVLPESITGIQKNAFKNCVKLTSVDIPDSVISIGSEVFYGCSRLSSISIPNLVISIGTRAFYGCNSLTSIIIPESVTSIGDSVFRDCSSLTSITIPESVISIGTRAFYGCSSLASITIPESVISIGEYAFYRCSSLTSITIPESVTSIGFAAFAGCSRLTGSIIIPQDVYKIEGATFGGCSSLTSITIPESVISIGEEAFYDCGSLISISIPESVMSIGQSAFYGCSSLKTITIPESVISIGWRAFYGCSSLTSITLPESVTSIEGDTFRECSSLTSITIPESVISIGESAFWACSSLTSITIPESVTSIGKYAFYCCDNLTSIVCLAKTPPSGVDPSTFGSCDFYVPTGYVDTYKAANGWSFYSDRIYSMEGGYVPPSGDGGND